MKIRENFLRAIEFKNPDWIPCTLSIAPIAIKKYKFSLEEIKKKYNILFKRDAGYNSIIFKGLAKSYKKGYFKDSWGCIWRNDLEGLEGQVVKNPLNNWNNFKTYKAPDPLATRPNEFGEGEFNWDKIKENIKSQRKEDKVIWGCGERLFDRLYFLRGFENLMMDFATDNPNLPKLIEMLYQYEKKLINKWLNIGVDIMWFHTDIGTQSSLMISPQMFRKYLKPIYNDLFTMCRRNGVHVYLSTDGRVIEIIDDFIECGVSMHDPQTGAISIEEIKKYYKGKICIFLDLDRQKFPFYKPKYLERLVKESVDMLSSTQGGLMLWAVIYDNSIPLENIEALCKAFIKYCF